MRIFAGPNGSGKSTIIRQVRATKIDGYSVDLGTYVNADDIAMQLSKLGRYSFKSSGIVADEKQLMEFADASGLLRGGFTRKQLSASVGWSKGTLVLEDETVREQVAQLIAQFLYDRLLAARKKFSFETVFSHPGKLDIMHRASEAGYKVYLYFVSTESADINVERVAIRVQQGGHAVPEDKIRERYNKSLGLLYDAVQLAHHGFLFDNSSSESVLFAEFRQTSTGRNWPVANSSLYPDWFIRSYVTKQSGSSKDSRK